MFVGVLEQNSQEMEWSYAERLRSYRIACCGFIRAEAGGRFTAILRKYMFQCHGV
jgi:hypothetical protein